MHILGISALYHDSAAALCRDGEIVAAAQEERFSRLKHDPSFPGRAIDYCLREAAISPYGLDAIVYYDNPLLTLDRFLNNIVGLGCDSRIMIEKSSYTLFERRLWIHRLAENHLGCLGDKRIFFVTRHHISHAASAFYPSPFEQAAILTMDGVGEWATTAIGRGEGGRIDLLEEIDYPHSLGLLFSAFTYFCGFKVNSGDYKLMGLAPYGEPRYYDVIRKNIIDVKADGSYRLNMDFFDYHRNAVMTNDAFARLFDGPPRKPEGEISRREMDLAASVQKVLEETVLSLARHARDRTGMKNLALAGGVALNCVANGKLLREKVFDRIWIQPAAGDAGGALGAALFAAHAHFGCPRIFRGRDGQKGCRLGPQFSPAEIGVCLDKFGAVYHCHDDKRELYAKTAALIADGRVCGFFNGRMEFGPRALGSRSILADPRNPAMQSRLNLKIKFRESFRPFAPSVLSEKAGEYFDIGVESPYMLICADVKSALRKPFSLTGEIRDGYTDLLPIVNRVRSTIPAVTHVDYSARVQTVHRDDDRDYHMLIEEFEKLTGCAVLVNTSFNVRGEPMVCSPGDAYACFMRTDMDVLVMENILLHKAEQPTWEEAADWRELHALD
jgi:carbamoyltransferase